MYACIKLSFFAMLSHNYDIMNSKFLNTDILSKGKLCLYVANDISNNSVQKPKL